MTGDSGLQFWFCFCSGDVHFLLCQGIGLNSLNDSELLTNKLSSEKQSWQPTPGSSGTSAAWPCPSQLMPPLKAAALLVEACCRHLLLDPPKRRWGQATPWFSSQTLVIILATSPLKTFWLPEQSFVRGRRHWSFRPRPGDLAQWPDQLRSGGVSWIWLRSSGLASAIVDPPPSRTWLRTKRNKRDRLFSLGTFTKTRFMLFAFITVIGPQILPEKLKVQFACPRLSFYLKEQKE